MKLFLGNVTKRFVGRKAHLPKCKLQLGNKHIEVPSENVGTWRGVFEPSTVTFEVERERAHRYACYLVAT
jgi:hypothetical protein